jgi:glutamine synthetase type III
LPKGFGFLGQDIEKAHLLAKEILPTMADLRSVCDHLEGVVGGGFKTVKRWSLENLFEHPKRVSIKNAKRF